MQPLEGLYYFTQVVEHGGSPEALAGLGIAQLPESVVREDLRSGALKRVLV